MAQTRVEKKVATKATGYGVTYYLPKTVFVITVEMTKTTYKAGPYFRYADIHLGIKDPVMEDMVSYELDKVSLINKGIPDLENTYVVEFKTGTVAPYVFLTEDGLLCSINTEYIPIESVAKTNPPVAESEDLNVTTLFTEEYLKASSEAKRAEILSKEINLRRERKMDILTGVADYMPPDGESMKLVIKGLEDQEKMLTRLFAGSSTKETFSREIMLIPQDNINDEVLFRFSKKQGMLDADDLGGDPVYINLRILERAPELSPKEAEKKEKAMKGIIYNLPGKARVEIKTVQNTLYRGELQIVQFGTQENLTPIMFEDKKSPIKVTFYPETGTIKQINP
jgi:hypothetical protein